MKSIQFIILYFILSLISFNLFGQSRPDSHAPIGVMGDHTHAKGEFMVSYRFMTMQMGDSRVGTDNISADEIATTVPNRFANPPMMPPTLRVVPESMTMNMHMLGVMYAPTDWLTLMAMGMFVQKEMDHITYQGPMGNTVLGNFTTDPSGIGDTKISALFSVWSKSNHKLILNFGLSIPTGSITEEGEVLAPTNMRPTLRLPYPMQLGSGTYDLLPGITYTSFQNNIAWGGQLSGILRLGENDEQYTFGNQLLLTTWGSYRIADFISASLRGTYTNIGQIDGIDPVIMAPVQTANPDFQGGQRIDVSLGVNLIGQSGFIKNMRLAVEFDLPVYQDLNGPQMQMDYGLIAGWQYAF